MRRIFLTCVLFCAVLVAGPRQASAAESLNAAVEKIAEQFVAHRAGEKEAVRLAVTTFVQSDRRTTQFTNLLMIALTGKMVQHGSGTYRVIERAQLETALAEIQITDVPIFDRDTAQKLGKFLGVDVLIVGEITPLSDVVRIDARLIEVETVETLDTAYEWVPLTPTVQRQLETAAIVSRPRIGGDDEADPRNGIWRGTGTCGETLVGVAVSVVVGPSNKLSAMQSYYPLAQDGPGSNLQSGVLAMAGTVDPDTGSFSLAPTDWLYQPSGHGALGFSGVMDTGNGVIRAKYDQEGCGDVNLQRMR